jgi:hypothetical protein
MDVAADLAGQEQPENPEPRGVCERLEEGLHLSSCRHIYALTNITRRLLCIYSS